MNIRKYNSNFGKALFLGWVRSLLYCLIMGIVCLVIGIVQRRIDNAGTLFLIVMVLSWPLDILWRWKSFILEGDDLIVKRFLRPSLRIDIKENLLSKRVTEHGLYGSTMFTISKIRMVGPDGSITDILCPFLTLSTLDEMMFRVEERRISHEGGAIGCL